jgi:hypothetical protein
MSKEMRTEANPRISMAINTEMILRLGAGICFIGHGVLALGAKAKFMALLSTFGIESTLALSLLKVIGCLDILIGLFILLKPNRLVLLWAMVWTSLTIVAWGIHGDSMMDLARRVTFMTTPFALLVLLYRNKKAKDQGNAERQNEDQHEHSTTALPIGVLTKEKEAAINSIDLSMISMKLMNEHDGVGWNEHQCAEVEKEYKRYLILNMLYPDENIVPNMAIDTMWHYHILDTQAYQRDCQTVFGYFLHHYPYFGMQGEADEKQFVSSFDRTKMLYEKTFGATMEGPDYLPSFQILRSA